jgi:hypothetical protein
MYLKEAGRSAGALTTTVYSSAPFSSRAPTNSRTVVAFWPIAT